MRETQTYARWWEIELRMGKAQFIVDFWTTGSRCLSPTHLVPIFDSSQQPCPFKQTKQTKCLRATSINFTHVDGYTINTNRKGLIGCHGRASSHVSCQSMPLLADMNDDILSCTVGWVAFRTHSPPHPWGEYRVNICSFPGGKTLWHLVLTGKKEDTKMKRGSSAVAIRKHLCFKGCPYTDQREHRWLMPIVLLGKEVESRIRLLSSLLPAKLPLPHSMSIHGQVRALPFFQPDTQKKMFLVLISRVTVPSQ